MNIKLKTKIIESGFMQIEVAKEVGIPESHFSKIVRGLIDPKDDLKDKIASALNCKRQDIFN